VSYLDTAQLTQNPEFQGRVIAAASEQALIFVDDARPEFVIVAQDVIRTATNAYPLVALVAGKPAINQASTDGDILAALQAVWPVYGSALLAVAGGA
jgi:hypothetical protein